MTVENESFTTVAGEFLALERSGKPGDDVNMETAMTVQVILGRKSYPNKVAIQGGPQVLAVDKEPCQMGKLPEGWIGDRLYEFRRIQNAVEKAGDGSFRGRKPDKSELGGVD